MRFAVTYVVQCIGRCNKAHTCLCTLFTTAIPTCIVYQEFFVVKTFFGGIGKPRKFNTRKFFYNENLLQSTQIHTYNLRTCIRRPAALVPMALLQFLQPTTGLPDPRGALSLSVPSQAIAELNHPT